MPDNWGGGYSSTGSGRSSRSTSRSSYGERGRGSPRDTRAKDFSRPQRTSRPRNQPASATRGGPTNRTPIGSSAQQAVVMNNAVKNVQDRIDNRNNPKTLMEVIARPMAFNVLDTMSDFFAERIIRDLRAGGTPVYDKDGNVTGSRSESGSLTGRDPVADAAAAMTKRTSGDNDKPSDNVASQPAPAPDAELAAADGTRRSLIPLNRRRSSANARGPGRRSFLT